MFRIYKTTNKLNGKYYVGVSNGNNPWYLGSGTALKSAIKKHGAGNFDVEILETFDTEDAMYAREAEIVNEDFVNNRMTYNVKLGGRGGKGSTKSEEHKKHLSESIKEKHRLGLVKNAGKNAGRKRKMPYEELVNMVAEHGIPKTAELLEESYEAVRSRYYTAKKRLTNNTQ